MKASLAAVWYESQRSCVGTKCCDEADAEPYYGSWTFNGDGSVKLDNGARINSCMVMRGPNSHWSRSVVAQGRNKFLFCTRQRVLTSLINRRYYSGKDEGGRRLRP